jgi:hypothetical protein
VGLFEEALEVWVGSGALLIRAVTGTAEELPHGGSDVFEGYTQFVYVAVLIKLFVLLSCWKKEFLVLHALAPAVFWLVTLW